MEFTDEEKAFRAKISNLKFRKGFTTAHLFVWVIAFLISTKSVVLMSTDSTRKLKNAAMLIGFYDSSYVWIFAKLAEIRYKMLLKKLDLQDTRTGRFPFCMYNSQFMQSNGLEYIDDIDGTKVGCYKFDRKLFEKLGVTFKEDHSDKMV